VVGLAGDVAFDASNGFAFGQAVRLAALEVGLRFRAVTQPDQGDQVEGAVGVAVTGGVESVAVGLAAAGRDRAGGAERGEGGFGSEPFGVAPGGDEQLGGVLDADAEPDRPRRVLVQAG
jgi:hypothetical protein